VSRSLNDLNPMFRPYADKFLAALTAAGIQYVVASTLRPLAEQEKLYAIGRTGPGRIVTNAKPGSSAHNYGLAMDVYPLIHGKLCTNTPEGDEVSDPVWQQFGQLAREAGLEWAGDWVSFKEAPHVQMKQWRYFIPKAVA
jgi:peptidoglycan L-alanyl-D-glutamate endopeptidase CwlK